MTDDAPRRPFYESRIQIGKNIGVPWLEAICSRAALRMAATGVQFTTETSFDSRRGKCLRFGFMVEGSIAWITNDIGGDHFFPHEAELNDYACLISDRRFGDGEVPVSAFFEVLHDLSIAIANSLVRVSSPNEPWVRYTEGSICN